MPRVRDVRANSARVLALEAPRAASADVGGAERADRGSGTAISWPWPTIAHEGDARRLERTAAARAGRRPRPRASARIAASSAFAAAGVEAVEPHVRGCARPRRRPARAGSRPPSRRRHRPARSRAAMPSFSASRAACSGAAPPKAISVRPRDVLAALDGVHARGVGHVLVDDLADAERGQLGRPGRAAADMRGQRRARPSPRSSGMRRRRSASGSIRPSTRSASVTVGCVAAAAVAGRARARRRRCPGPTVMRCSASTRAIEPPPAPISTISITGMRSGRPLPFMKRSTRSTSKVRDVCGSTVVDQADLGGGAAHVEGQHLRRRRSAARCARARIAPPAGPDSTSRIGKRARRLERGQAAARGHQVAAGRRSRARASAARAAPR